MLVPLVLLVVAVAMVLGAVRVAQWWAGVPLGIVHQDGRVSLRLSCRVLSAEGRCGADGELSVGSGVIQVWEAGRLRLDAPVGEVIGEVVDEPRPALALSTDAARVVVVVDRLRPVPVAVGALGLRRQTTSAQAVIGALGEAVREGEFGRGDLSPYVGEAEEPSDGSTGRNRAA